MSSEIFEVVKGYVEGHLPTRNRGLLEPETVLWEGGIIESLSLLSLVSFLESHIELQVPDDDLRAENFATLGVIVALVERLKKP